MTEDGTMQPPEFVRHFVGVSLNRQLIGQWQLEQTGRTDLVFRYVPLREDELARNLADIEEAFRLVFGPSISIQMQQVREIPPSPSGKVRWIVNSMRSPASPSTGRE